MRSRRSRRSLLRGLPDEIVLGEILVRLDPKSILRCRAVRRDWRSATSTRRFLLAHHARQPAVPILSHSSYHVKDRHKQILAKDYHRTDKVDAVVRFDEPYHLVASCDGLLLLDRCLHRAGGAGTRLAVCNPATREVASPGPLADFNTLGMYPHRPTGEYRLLLQGRSHERSYGDPPSDRTGFYVLALGSRQPPRYIGGSETRLASATLNAHAWLRDCLHFHKVHYHNPSEEEYKAQSELVIVFDAIAESFGEMRAPLVPTKSCIFEMDDMLGIYTCNDTATAQVVDIWVLHNYESEVWDLKYRVELPIEGIRGKVEGLPGDWLLKVVSGDGGDVLLLVCFGPSTFYIDTDGKLVTTLKRSYPESHRLKQSLVDHDFFSALDGYAVNYSPIISSK